MTCDCDYNCRCDDGYTGAYTLWFGGCEFGGEFTTLDAALEATVGTSPGRKWEIEDPYGVIVATGEGENQCCK